MLLFLVLVRKGKHCVYIDFIHLQILYIIDNTAGSEWSKS